MHRRVFVGYSPFTDVEAGALEVLVWKQWKSGQTDENLVEPEQSERRFADPQIRIAFDRRIGNLEEFVAY